jgi:3-oxoacyl-[acyl-carrier protein] reductase
MTRESLLKEKVAVVTGASGGLGSAICRTLAAHGCTVVAGYNSSAGAANELVAALGGAPHLALPVPVTNSNALSVAAATIARELGQVDILVNCAGTTRFVAHADLDGLDDDLIDEILATNVRGPFAVVRALRGLLAASGAGLVVNISSIAARTATGSNIMYCASKAALDNMTMSLARALGPAIRVVSVAPGLIDTEFVKSLDQEWRDQQLALTVLGRLATPEEVANAVVAAATSLSFSTGIVIPVDGGRPLK